MRVAHIAATRIKNASSDLLPHKNFSTLSKMRKVEPTFFDEMRHFQ